MKPYHTYPVRQVIFAVAAILFLIGCSKTDSTVEKQKPSHLFTNLPATADERLVPFTDSLLVSEDARPWMDSVIAAIGSPAWEHAAFGVQSGAPSVMLPLINSNEKRVTGLLVMVKGDRFRFRVIDSRRPERYGYNNGRNAANARTIFIAADLFNQRAFPDAEPAAIGECMMTRTERQHFESARKSGGSFTPMVKAAGYAMSITCYTTMACTGDGRGNCIGNIVYSTDCIYNYIWVEDSGWGSSGPGGEGGYGGGGIGGGGGGSVGPGNGSTNPCGGSSTPPGQNTGPLAVLPPTKPIVDVKKYVRCFDRTGAAKLTLYADQPQAGSDEPFTVKGKVGHSYITIEQNFGGQIVRRTLGFHPFEAVSPFFAKEGQSQLGDDSDASYDVRLDVNISGEALAKVLSIIESFNPQYHLENYNCTNFVLDVSDACGLKIPRTKAWWLVGSGLNPGSFGEDLKKVPGAVSGRGRSDDNTGECN
ncbi:hypothetical protein WJU16_22245 [Chitinophaga pollutisoli]|uniref:DUF4105 domain-containing protein n=1 Tax=Chitinophaga pollutisoli TaxID=3133966 RepID=A0ABZ2YN01_9BACT